jgi:hypothetical protein
LRIGFGQRVERREGSVPVLRNRQVPVGVVVIDLESMRRWTRETRLRARKILVRAAVVAGLQGGGRGRRKGKCK